MAKFRPRKPSGTSRTTGYARAVRSNGETTVQIAPASKLLRGQTIIKRIHKRGLRTSAALGSMSESQRQLASKLSVSVESLVARISPEVANLLLTLDSETALQRLLDVFGNKSLASNPPAGVASAQGSATLPKEFAATEAEKILREAKRQRLLQKLRDNLAEASNGLVSPKDLSDALGESRDTLKSWARANRILAVPVEGINRYPRIQFDANWHVLEGLEDCLKELDQHGIVEWMALDVMVSADPKYGVSPVQLLQQGRLGDALNCARSLANQGAP